MVSQVPQAGAHGRGGAVCGERTATALCRKRMDGRGAQHPGRSCPPVCGSQTERFALTYGEHAQRHHRPASLQALSGGQEAVVGRLLLVSLLLRRNRRRHDADHRQEVSRTGAGLMRKAFKYRIYPNQQTEQRSLWMLSRCRELYHAALTERRDAYHFHVRQHPNYYDLETRKRLTSELTVSYTSQQNDLPQIKADLREKYQDIAAPVLQHVLRRLDRAFQGFFQRVRNGQAPGYPR